MYYLIYKITNNVNNKIYIGKHQTENKDDDYMGSGKIIKRAIEKYGIDKFTKEILYECNSLEEMNEKEAEIVDEEFVARLDTYNIKLGGQGGFDYINNYTKWRGTDYINSIKGLNLKNHQNKMVYDKLKIDKKYAKEFSQKISTGLKLYYQNHSSNFVNRKHTDESKAKIGKANAVHQQGKNNSQYGTCWIYNDIIKENKKIKKEELQFWLEQGWKKGRKMK